MPAKQSQKALIDAAVRDEIAHLIREFVQSRAVGANREEGVGLAQHHGQLDRRIAVRQRCPFRTFIGRKNKSAHLAASASNSLNLQSN